MSNKYLIILVDDEAEILEYYMEIMPVDKFECLSFTNPSEALEVAIDNISRLVLVLSDFKMPEQNGFEFREKLLENGIDCPFSLITGFYDKKMATEGMRLKISSFLEKPVNDEDILSLIESEVTRYIESIEEDREMVTEFLQETKPMLEEIEDLILCVEEDPEDIGSINTYFRLLHTIKGTSSCLGLNEISNYAHKYEDLINQVKSNDISINRKVINVLLEGLDQLKKLYDLAADFAPFPSNLDELAQIFAQDFSQELSGDSDDQPLDIANKVEKVANVNKDKKEKDEKITVSESLLSEFLEMSGELTVIRNTIFKTMSTLHTKLNGDKNFDHLSESMLELQKVSTVLQNQIAEMKKVEIESVYRPMRRVVRDSCSVLNKEIDFVIEGDSFKVDTSVAKLLNAVLVHLLRNGVDHGIEDAETRQNCGKSANGKLILNAYETGENVIVEIIDDGKGLNKEFLKKKALEKGLYTQDELEGMNDQKIFGIIFESGFSTNTEVTSVSGRGVGMDMVKSSIEEAGGRILIDSTLGEGSKFILVIPIPRSILIIKSLMVTTHNAQFNIALDDVDEVVLLDSQKSNDDIHELNGVHILRHHGDLFPLVHLGHTLALSSSNNVEDDQNIVIVKGEGYRYGILVDAINDIEEIVVKKLSKHFETPEYMGMTFSDDGALSLILDCKGIAERHGIDNYRDDSVEDNFVSQNTENTELFEYMRFSLAELKNCAIELKYIFRLEEVKVSDIQYTGSRALVRYRNKSLPLIYIEHELGITDMSLDEAFSAGDDILDVLVVSVNDKLYGAIINQLSDIAASTEPVNTSFSDREGVMGTVTIDETIITVLNIHALVGQIHGHLSFNNMESTRDVVIETKSDPESELISQSSSKAA